MTLMSDVYPTRLYWAGFRGVARLAGNEMRLTRPPAMPGIAAVDGVDYVPGVLAQVMPRGERWRDMTMDEIEAVRTFLGLDDSTVCIVLEAARPRSPSPAR